MTPRTHQFAAVAFEENLSLRDLAAAYPDARLGLRDMRVSVGDDEEIFIYPFGAVVFHDAPPERRETELARLGRARPGLTTQVVRESFTVREEPGTRVDIPARLAGMRSTGKLSKRCERKAATLLSDRKSNLRPARWVCR